MPSYLGLFEVFFDDFWLALAQNFTDFGDPAIGVPYPNPPQSVLSGRVQKIKGAQKLQRESPRQSKSMIQDYHTQHESQP